MDKINIIYLIVGIAFITYLGVGLFLKAAVRYRILDIPNDRSSHSVPTPRGGGLALVIITFTGLLWLSSSHFSSPASAWLGVYYVSAGLIALVSWLDDLRSLPYPLRFVVHIAGAGIVILFFSSWPAIHLPLFGIFSLGWVGIPITLLWVVGLTNAYNFMDGIDGIATGPAIITAATWMLLGIQSEQSVISVLGLLIMASCIGFFFYNWHPARIFLGDVGSTFLGFSFAVLPLIGNFYEGRIPLFGLMAVWPIVLDASYTFFRRLLKRENVFTAHRTHLYQRLVIRGYSHQCVAILYMALTILSSLMGWLYVRGGELMQSLAIICVVVFGLALILYVEITEKRLEQDIQEGSEKGE